MDRFCRNGLSGCLEPEEDEDEEICGLIVLVDSLMVEEPAEGFDGEDPDIGVIMQHEPNHFIHE